MFLTFLLIVGLAVVGIVGVSRPEVAVSIYGTNSSISGNDMWNDYQNIRSIGDCKKCGSFHREDGCLLFPSLIPTVSFLNQPLILQFSLFSDQSLSSVLLSRASFRTGPLTLTTLCSHAFHLITCPE